MSASDAKSPRSEPAPQSSDTGGLQKSGARTIDSPPGEELSHNTGPGGDTPTLKELLAHLTVGTVIDGKYAIDAIIGRGGMGVVVSARHIDLGREVALKFLCSGEGVGSSADLRARFRREAQISAKLDNEHITRVLDVGSWKNASYIVMERLEGVDLRRKLKQSGGGLPMPVALNYTLQICEGIAEAHAHGIVHRDLKPANLFVTRKSDGSDLIKIMDFGISKWNGGEIGEITKDGTLLGSPKYMAPEQVFGTKAIDARADIWSIGAILFEMLSGRTPYVETTLARLCGALVAGPPPRLDEIKPELPSRLADAVARSLEGSPSARTPTVAELAGSLLDAVDAPGDALRERLAIILAMRPAAADSGVASTGNLMSNLGLGPVSGRTPPSQSISQSEPSLTPSRPSGPPAAQTLVSPVSRANPVTETAEEKPAPAATLVPVAPAAPEAQRSRTVYIVVAAAIAAAATAFVVTRTTASARAPQPALTTAATAPPAPVVTQAPAVTQAAAVTQAPAATQAPTAAPTGATPADTAPVAPVRGGRPVAGGPRVVTPPVRPAGQPAATPVVKEKKGDDDIPTLR